MALLDLLRDALEGHLESKRVQLLGPDYRQKQAESAARVGLLGAQTRGAEADVLGTEARTRQTGVQTGQMEQAGKDIEEQKAELRRLAETGALPSAYLPIVQTMLEKQTGESQGSLRDAQRQQALAGIPTREERLAELEGTRATTDLRRAQAEEARRGPAAGGGGLAANPFLMMDETGEERLVGRTKDGRLIFIDQVGNLGVKPAGTAEMRNTEIQGQAVEPAFELLNQSLDNLEKATSGLGSTAKAMVPGTSAYHAKQRFLKQATAFLGAIVARQSGEGSRLSDEDRRAYSQAASIVNDVILLPGGIEEARGRMKDVKDLLDTVQARRRLRLNPAAGRRGAVSGEEVVTDLPGGGWDQGAADALSDRPVPRRGLRVLSVEEIE